MGDPFAKHFESAEMVKDQYAPLFVAGVRGDLANIPLRSLFWKLFLGVVPRGETVSAWPAALDLSRKKYDELVIKYETIPGRTEDDDPLSNNPLSTVADSPWQTFWKNEEVKKEINTDLERTCPENDFFQEQRVITMMERILFIYVSDHDGVSYRQGMHELLAPVILSVDTEKIVNSTNSTKGQLLDSKYVEHDSYALFARIMAVAADWFEVDRRPIQRRSNLGTDDLGGENEDTSKLSPIIQLCNLVQGQLLEQHDPPLATRLKQLDIEPQLYALKWIRLLFGREFHMIDSCKLWDALFADSPNLTLVPYFALSMLRFVRDYLLGAEQAMAMRRLFKYPPVENVSTLVEQALIMRDGPDKTAKIFPHVEPQAPPPHPAAVALAGHADGNRRSIKIPNKEQVRRVLNRTSQSQVRDPQQKSSGRGRVLAPGGMFKQVASAQSSPGLAQRQAPSGTEQYASMERELKALKASLPRQGARLDDIVNKLQRELMSSQGSDVEPAYDTGVVLYCLAELKQIRDILSLTLEDPEIDTSAMMMEDTGESGVAAPSGSPSAPSAPVPPQSSSVTADPSPSTDPDTSHPVEPKPHPKPEQSSVSDVTVAVAAYSESAVVPAQHQPLDVRLRGDSNDFAFGTEDDSSKKDQEGDKPATTATPQWLLDDSVQFSSDTDHPL